MLLDIKELSDHMFWADSKVWSEVMKISQHNKIQHIFDLLFHLHTVQHAYLCIWNNQPLNNLGKNEFKNLSELSNWGKDFHRKYKVFIDSLDDERMNNVVSIPWTEYLEKKIGKPPEASSLIQTIYQVVMHSTYHRGQINTKIRELGGEPPLTDFIYWIWLNKPNADFTID